MRTELAKILLLFYLFAALTPQQLKSALVKLPFLIQHYQEHQQEEDNTSFTSFIIEHYGEGFAKHSSEHNHSQLPGKGEHSNAQAFETIKAFLTLLPSALFDPLSNLLLKAVRFVQITHLPPSAHLSSIWQPPKA